MQHDARKRPSNIGILTQNPDTTALTVVLPYVALQNLKHLSRT